MNQPIPHATETTFSGTFRPPGGEIERLTLRQNLEAPNADHWQVDMNLTRWRTKAELVAYLRAVADLIERMPVNEPHAPTN